MTKALFAVAYALAALACSGSKSTTPTPTTTVALLGRWGHGMAYDATNHVVLMFGGRGPATAGATESDQRTLWSWDGTKWHRLSDGTTGPSARNSFAAAFDVARGRFVVFGGRTGTDPTNPAFGDTWEWTGTAWTQSLSLQGGLAAREHVAGAYDPVRQKVAIAGGFDPASGQDLHDHWEWNGTAWTQLNGSVQNLGFAPVMANSGTKLTLFQSATTDRSLKILEATGAGVWTAVNPSGTVPKLTAYAATQLPGGGILVFGGSDGTNTLSDTWTWNGTVWTKLSVTGPPARLSAAMAFDATRGKVVLFGGQNAAGTPLTDTWEFNGTTWTLVLAVPTPEDL